MRTGAHLWSDPTAPRREAQASISTTDRDVIIARRVSLARAASARSVRPSSPNPTAVISTASRSWRLLLWSASNASRVVVTDRTSTPSSSRELTSSRATVEFPRNNTDCAFTPSGSYNQAWAPTISTAPTSVVRGSTYTISGTQFKGLSQGAAYGDDFEGATNFPLVRIVNNATGHVFYCRTHDHSTMAVATGGKTVSTLFDVPANTETGASQLFVVANGIASPFSSLTVN